MLSTVLKSEEGHKRNRTLSLPSVSSKLFPTLSLGKVRRNMSVRNINIVNIIGILPKYSVNICYSFYPQGKKVPLDRT